MRQHTERIRPPRALWVSFELGRPLGVPNDAEFQMDVLKAALDLLTRDKGPVLADYPRDAEGPIDMTGWACPVSFDSDEASSDGQETLLADHVGAEIAKLAPWYNIAMERRGGTTVGASGKSIDEIISFLAAQLDGDVSPDDANLIKFAAEDLRAYYIEAATAQPGPTTGKGLMDWFFGETSGGALLLTLQPKLAGTNNSRLQALANFQLVPRPQMHFLQAPNDAT